MCKSPASPEFPTRGHAHGAVEKIWRSEQGLSGKIGQKDVNRKLLHIAQGLCREFGVWVECFARPSAVLCRGGDSQSRRCTADSYRAALKWKWLPNCHCEEAAGRRGNLGEAVTFSPISFPRSGRVLRDCHVASLLAMTHQGGAAVGTVHRIESAILLPLRGRAGRAPPLQRGCVTISN